MRDQQLHPLLTHLSATKPNAPEHWGDWSITPVTGGANGLLFRATGQNADLAVKFTQPDSRDRAGREYGALAALRQAGHDLAPKPILIERHRYALPVIVQTWLDGEALSAPPERDEDWERLIEHYVAIHRVTPAHVDTDLSDAFWNAPDARRGIQMVHAQVSLVPPEARPPELDSLARRLDAWRPPRWPAPPRALCRVDANYRNFIARPGAWASVDWENSGWGDPAFEMADIISHVVYINVPEPRWEWLARTYAELSGDLTALLRIQTYSVIALVWWVARIARYRYEVPRGLDQRLVTRPASWETEMAAKERHYLGAAKAALDRAGA